MASKNHLLEQFNEGLLGMRELFHEAGRLEDSNSKLDEITKLLCLEIVSVRDNSLKIPSLKQLIEEHNSSESLVTSLNEALILAGKSNILTNYNGESLLGPNPKFNIAPSEGYLAKGLAKIVLDSFNGHLRGRHSTKSFEFLNEAFCHFVRDNFRQNIEDAQYMTPPEAVNFMVEIGIKRLLSKKFTKSNPPIVCDPSCGVGSFLAQFYREWVVDRSMSIAPHLVGQDKVDRMARLSLLNLSLFGITDMQIFRGNSLQKGSPLDNYTNKCDLILTNPPFGAKFSCSDLKSYSSEFFTNLDDLIKNRAGKIDSELLFLDRYLSLLKPGGVMLAVLPDSVISASGIPSFLRDEISSNFTIKSITELPAVTFAQAGTRTKTCILEVEKKLPANNYVIVSKINSIGFEVSSRKGVPYKRSEGENELKELSKVFSRLLDDNNLKNLEVVSETPSTVVVSQDTLSENGWTPSHFSSDRIGTLQQLNNLEDSDDYDICELSSLVTIATKSRRGIKNLLNAKCISVLHIGAFGALNVKEMLEYKPKTLGKICVPGDILFSKINPRIPRVLVVPHFPFPLTCSSEFEVMRPKKGFNAFEIMLLLLSEYAQKQILSLTSGTSSSHNRIKTKELLSIRVVIPKKKSKFRNEYDRTVKAFENANIQLNKSNEYLQDAWRNMNNIISFQPSEGTHKPSDSILSL